ncbi:two-component system response regulator [Clavibacter michiganensis]|uniref:response regulator transcription factor n=1 Tax=Clavibacter michiganensis TaxID=28447 RepID=UPI000CE7BA93|nr:response regulator [Clavibacter michiganensis]PPF53389.1 two-component system response regulator [Clavibacter michiganensis]
MTDDLTVLIVDDDFRIARLHEGIVAQAPGFRPVGTASSVRAALAVLDSERPDLVLLDAYLPDGSGVDLVRRIEPDVILVTAADDAATVRRALRGGAVSYLVKPFAPELLAARLAAYAAFRAGLATDRPLDQAGIDRAIQALRPGRASTQARPATEQAVLDALSASDEELSAPEIAERVGVSRATAQRYLGALARDRVVDVQLNYGSTGRPEHRYRILRPR